MQTSFTSSKARFMNHKPSSQEHVVVGLEELFNSQTGLADHKKQKEGDKSMSEREKERERDGEIA